MVLFDIPDIRLFWTDDNRFAKQFSPGNRRCPLVRMRDSPKDVCCLRLRVLGPATTNSLTVFGDAAGDLRTKFVPYSKYPPCNKDVSFWISDKFSENNLCEIARNVAGDLVEEIKLIDQFTHPKTVSISDEYLVEHRDLRCPDIAGCGL
jgi:phenylalanyl-tRNA synthetase alpha chain